MQKKHMKMSQNDEVSRESSSIVSASNFFISKEKMLVHLRDLQDFFEQRNSPQHKATYHKT